MQLFISGNNIDHISKKFKCTKLTVSRNLKSNLGEISYKQFLEKSKSKNKLIEKKTKINNLNKNGGELKKDTIKNNFKTMPDESSEEEFLKTSQFIEIVPLDYDIDNSLQKDFSSIPISEINLPKTVFMIVDKKIELEIKYLKDYPKWQFLSQDELKRKTIEIYNDLKTAKSFCGKDQKVIKLPNTDVLKIVAPILISRGISRIVSSDKLIAL